MRRNPKGSSDSINYDCQCTSGTVLLYYNYIPFEPSKVSSLLLETAQKWNLTGKIRLATTGYNITVAGQDEQINMWMDMFIKDFIPHEIPSDLLQRFKLEFFKPSPGCQHVFDGLSVKVVDELCPLLKEKDTTHRQVTSQLVLDSILDKKRKEDGVFHLPPDEFHRHLNENIQLLDLRNYYESQIGKFQGAICPPIRRFSSLKDWIQEQKGIGPKLYTYCTGGIRCDQSAEFLHEATGSQIYMLQGGIHNYLAWAKENNIESRFQGANYVFDARQSLAIDESNVISECRKCNTRTKNLVKCPGRNCHLIMVACDSCIDYCCLECKEKTDNIICKCEQIRRAKFSDQMFIDK